MFLNKVLSRWAGSNELNALTINHWTLLKITQNLLTLHIIHQTVMHNVTFHPTQHTFKCFQYKQLQNHFLVWFGLGCLKTPGLSKDIRCHVWPYFF